LLDVPDLGAQGGQLKLPDDLDITPSFFAPAKIRGSQISPDGDMAGDLNADKCRQDMYMGAQ
jgi:hypothetical protein